MYDVLVTVGLYKRYILKYCCSQYKEGGKVRVQDQTKFYTDFPLFDFHYQLEIEPQ